jgi:NitT/TauT family transport system permease protein
MRSALPVATVVAAILAIWYAGAVMLNAQWTRDQAARAGTTVTWGEIARDTMRQDRPRLPAPHQVAAELWRSTWVEEVHSRRGIVQTGTLSSRSLVYHGWLTLSATVLGFAIGAALGLLLAIGIVYSRAMSLGVMPWAIASQTVPILAIAPMIIVVFASAGITGLVPKAIISAYLSFFPVVVGMVKGLRSPDPMQLDLLRTWNANRGQELWKLRLPASMPFLFASLKIGIAASLVGAIVGEIPVQRGGLGARLLAGSYYGQTLQIWATLVTAAILAALLIGAVGAVQRATLSRMGFAR